MKLLAVLLLLFIVSINATSFEEEILGWYLLLLFTNLASCFRTCLFRFYRSQTFVSHSVPKANLTENSLLTEMLNEAQDEMSLENDEGEGIFRRS